MQNRDAGGERLGLSARDHAHRVRRRILCLGQRSATIILFPVGGARGAHLCSLVTAIGYRRHLLWCGSSAATVAASEPAQVRRLPATYPYASPTAD